VHGTQEDDVNDVSVDTMDKSTRGVDAHQSCGIAPLE